MEINFAISLKKCKLMTSTFCHLLEKMQAFWGLAPFATKWRKGAFWGLAPFATKWRKGSGGLKKIV
jgi:predicted cobalt transporter CbtA